MDYACAYVQQEALVMSEASRVEGGVAAGGTTWSTAMFGLVPKTLVKTFAQQQQQNLT